MTNDSANTTTTTNNDKNTNILVYVIRGSQFSAKVLVGLDACNIKHHCKFVSLDETKRRNELPSGGILVPEMKVTYDRKDEVNVKDSEQILHWLDDNMNTSFFPTPLAPELSERVSNYTLAGFIYYYNWINNDGFNKVLPILIHGDSAFCGQGVVMETFALSQTRYYGTGGTIHIVINNQIGFTNHKIEDNRSSLYCTDIAKMVEAPIFHVNVNEPEAVVNICKFAVQYRMKFNINNFHIQQ